MPFYYDNHGLRPNLSLYILGNKDCHCEYTVTITVPSPPTFSMSGFNFQPEWPMNICKCYTITPNNHRIMCVFFSCMIFCKVFLRSITIYNSCVRVNLYERIYMQWGIAVRRAIFFRKHDRRSICWTALENRLSHLKIPWCWLPVKFMERGNILGYIITNV